MTSRPIFTPSLARDHTVDEILCDITWSSGFSPAQKKKNIAALHDAAKQKGYDPLLEVSTKSEERLGRRLSAFNVKIATEIGKISIESAFQGSKVFEGGGPYTDLYRMSSVEAKKDPRIKESGELIGFNYFGMRWLLEPKTVFYDWLYLTALHRHAEYIRTALSHYKGFTDIEFNPKKSINCQARSCALLLSLIELHVLNDVLQSPSNFIRSMRDYEAHRQAKKQELTEMPHVAEEQPNKGSTMTEPEKMKLESMDVAQEKREQLRKLFPEVFSENTVNFDQLKRALGEWVEPGKERFGLNWPGKSDCMKIIQQPSIATLKPARDESVNFDNSENLFIEGDNLEVLKLLQKSYFGKVKMIYIDPPYNTGKEFIYPDTYSETLNTYLEYTGQKDSEGRKFSTNTDASGRYHSRWLNMMYPRLYLAKNLLREDGVIFISIDDHEQAHLKKLCDEIFGEENFVATFTVKSNPRGSQSSKLIAVEHESIIAYSRNCENLKIIGYEKTHDEISDYSLNDESRKYRLLGLRQRGGAWRREDRPLLYYPIFINPESGEVSLTKDSIYTKKSVPQRPSGEEGRWTWGKEKFNKDKHLLIGKNVSRQGKEDFWDIFRKDYLLSNNGEIVRKKPRSIWDEKEMNYQNGRNQIRDLFDNSEIFDFPKPTFIVEKCVGMFEDEESIVLDFFAGSATTAHAVMQLNAEDGGKRRCISVQLPEPVDEKSEAFKAGYRTIADIAKERIRRAADKIAEEQNGTLDLNEHGAPDLGFKVFKLAPSNFRVWEGNVEKISNIKKELFDHLQYLNADSTPEDILYELLLKAGFPLTTQVETRKMAGKNVFSIDRGAVLICLDKKLNLAVINEMAKAKPSQVICLDEGFDDNAQLKVNAAQTFKTRALREESEIVFRTV